jgi:hypothetical protein
VGSLQIFRDCKEISISVVAPMLLFVLSLSRNVYNGATLDAIASNALPEDRLVAIAVFSAFSFMLYAFRLTFFLATHATT